MFCSSYEGSQSNIASCVTYHGSTYHRLNETLKKHLYIEYLYKAGRTFKIYQC